MRTTVNPLITNFMVPGKPTVVLESEMQIVYDPKEQITFLMGGGSSSGSRSYDGYKSTKEKTGGGYYEHNDAERWTDD